jgi:hypothetical protein
MKYSFTETLFAQAKALQSCLDEDYRRDRLVTLAIKGPHNPNREVVVYVGSKEARADFLYRASELATKLGYKQVPAIRVIVSESYVTYRTKANEHGDATHLYDHSFQTAATMSMLRDFARDFNSF